MAFSFLGGKTDTSSSETTDRDGETIGRPDEDLLDPNDLSLWRRRSGHPADTDRTDANLIALVSANGRIDSVPCKPTPGTGLPINIAEGSAVDSVWHASIAQRIKRNIRKALQTRQSYSNQFSESDDFFECIYVPQGRDRVMLIVRNISAARAQVAQLEDLAFRDAATGLPNREWLMSELEAILQRIGMRQGRGAVISLQIDELDAKKSIIGTGSTDAVMAILAARLAQALRGANQPNETDDERYSAVARIDTNRFAVVLPDIETGDDAKNVATRLTVILETPIAIGTRKLAARVPAGIALYPQDGNNAEELLENSIIALHDARHSETAQQKFHSGTVRMRAFERQDLVAELEAALEKGAFQLNYLPIVTADNRKVAAAEALLRWPRPVFGDRPIEEVIKVADYTGMILPIGNWVFSSACRQLVAWQNGGLEHLRIAVNVSAQEFARARLVERTEHILADTGIEAARVDVEITEHLLFRDAMRDFRVCRGLAELGCRVVVDDYGTGICSFGHVSGSPVSGLKIHQRFVARVDHDAASRAACAAITAMAHELGIEVAAEGVETEEQAEILSEIGCDYLQGFAFCTPSPADELTEFLHAHASVEIITKSP